MSVPFSRMVPDVEFTIRRMVCAVLVLPQPDSPTRASISPRASEKLIPSTACTRRRGSRASRPVRLRRTGYCVTRLSTSSSGASLTAPARPARG